MKLKCNGVSFLYEAEMDQVMTAMMKPVMCDREVTAECGDIVEVTIRVTSPDEARRHKILKRTLRRLRGNNS